MSRKGVAANPFKAVQLEATISFEAIRSYSNTKETHEATKTNMINTKRNAEENTTWKNQKGKLRTAFPALTDEDLNFDADRKTEMLGKLAVKLGKTTPELAKVLEKA